MGSRRIAENKAWNAIFRQFFDTIASVFHVLTNEIFLQEKFCVPQNEPEHVSGGRKVAFGGNVPFLTARGNVLLSVN